ncbi:MAG: hypothetical protein HYY13_04230 [Nitrospirae bacterium]|nr:hypothetical protein [Nitrospirota bacterium]
MKSNGQGRVLPFLLLLTTLHTSLFAASARAEPYIAVRAGEKCATCHVNRTGGGKRTDHAAKYGQKYLPIVESTPVSFRFAEVLSLGADMRVDDTLRRHHEPETLSSGITPTRDTHGTEVSQAGFYVETNLLDNLLNFYLDESFAPAATTREVFLRMDHPDTSSYLKIGRFFMPYGLRLVDNEAFIRQRTGYTMTDASNGLELGLDLDPLDLTALRLAVVDDADTGPDASGTVEIVHDLFRLGFSAGYQRGAGEGTRSLGAFLGIRLARPIQILAELDRVTAVQRGPDRDAWARYYELDVQPLKGLNLRGLFEIHDPEEPANKPDSLDEKRFGAGAEVFPIPFLQLGLLGSLATAGEGRAASLGHDRVFELLAQAHLFF